jgi:Nuclease-related domain
MESRAQRAVLRNDLVGRISALPSQTLGGSGMGVMRVDVGRNPRRRGAGSQWLVRAGCEPLIMLGWSFPRRQRYRRLRHAAASGAAGLVAGALAAIAAGSGTGAVAGALLLVAVGLLVDARRWVRLAARSRIGARSEDEVRHALAALEAEGWRLRYSLPYGGRGDIDSVVIAPTGIGFAIEVKTKSFERGHLAAVRAMAHWLHRRRRRWCRRGALPVLCVVRARAVERIDDGVLIVSLERLVGALRTAAGTAPRPGFIAADASHR